MRAAALTIIICLALASRSPARALDIEPEVDTQDAPRPATTTTTTTTTATSRPEQLTVIAPKHLRPSSDYHVLISLANSSVPATIDLQLIGARDSNREQVEAKSVLAAPDETQTVKFRVGADWPAAEYVLSVSAQAIDRSWNFTDEAPIGFQAKALSAFIQTDKAVYKPGQEVNFRALFLTPNLTPLTLKSEVNVSIENPKRNIIKQWNYLSNYRGLLTLSMGLPSDPMLGDYAIQVAARGQEFRKEFTVAEYVLPTFEVALELPPYATYNDSSDLVATVRATYTYAKPVQGQVTLTVQPLVRLTQIAARPLEQAQYRARLGPDGKADFQVNLVKDLKQAREYFEREVEFFALVEEDLTGRRYNKTQTIKVHESKVKIERLREGQQVAAGDLKPGLRQTMRYKVAYQDDTPVEEAGPPVELRYQVQGIEVASFRLTPQGGLIEHELLVPAKVKSSRLEGLEIRPDPVDVTATYRRHKHYLSSLRPRQSLSGQYLQIVLPQLEQRARSPPTGRLTNLGPSSSTSPSPNGNNQVSVGDELRVQVRATEPMQQATCQGLSRGDIVWALSRNVQGRREFEFEVRVEARMVPESRVLCFYVRPDDKELIADSRELLVAQGAAKNFVKLRTSRAEAKPGQEVEVGVFTKPSSLVGVLALDQSVLLLKSGNDLSAAEILDDYKSYGAAGSPASAGAPWSNPDTGSLFESSNVVVLTNNRVHSGSLPVLGRPLASPKVLSLESAARPSGGPSIALDRLAPLSEAPVEGKHCDGSDVHTRDQQVS